MTVNELRKALLRYDDYCVVVLGDSIDGWQNIEEITTEKCTVNIIGEKHPIFSGD